MADILKGKIRAREVVTVRVYSLTVMYSSVMIHISVCALVDGCGCAC